MVEKERKKIGETEADKERRTIKRDRERKRERVIEIKK
jgi:hypothetical protein